MDIHRGPSTLVLGLDTVARSPQIHPDTIWGLGRLLERRLQASNPCVLAVRCCCGLVAARRQRQLLLLPRATEMGTALA